jgi:ferredoxin
MPHVDLKERFKKLDIEVELGFTAEQAIQEVERCLNCDIQTVFAATLCIECDACIDICPVNCLTIAENGDEGDLRIRLSAPAENLEQALYISEDLPQTSRVMVKDEDLCVHCGVRNAAQRVHGICRNQRYCCHMRAMKPPVSNRMLRRRPPNRVLTWPQSTTLSSKLVRSTAPAQRVQMAC